MPMTTTGVCVARNGAARRMCRTHSLSFRLHEAPVTARAQTLPITTIRAIEPKVGKPSGPRNEVHGVDRAALARALVGDGAGHAVDGHGTAAHASGICTEREDRG